MADQLRRRRADAAGTNGAQLPFAGLDDEKKDKLSTEKSTSEPTTLLAKIAPWAVPITLTLLSFFTRLYKIGWSQYVVWDEAHFGKFASYYLKREFYFDVHPPLGKMLIGFAGVLAGYDGSFDFESGKKYPDNVNYTVIRIFCASFGALMVPLAYFTAIELGLSKKAATLAGSMVLMDIAYLAISRFILLDSMLLFFTVLSIYCLACFRATEDKPGPFTFEWYYWMAMTGCSLGCVLSVKWVGLFAIAVVGLYTIEDLWRLLGDKTISMKTYVHHWIARIICLIGLPIGIYLFNFVLHFAILNRSGTGDANMSSLFQAGLKGIDLDSNPLQVVYGSKATIKNNGHGGGLLHSHIQRYPTGSEQQQVTCYHHKDANNDWIFLRDWDRSRATGLHPDQEPITPIKDGDVIRVWHEQTGRNLHSHNHKAPVTVRDNEVSCYGNSTIGDMNDHWKVEIIDDAYVRRPTEIHALTTRFRLRHVTSGCLLKGHNVNLPQWGFKQLEVTCDKYAKGNERNVIWNVERHINPRLPPGSGQLYRSTFFKDFIDHNVGMWTTNNALTPDADKEPDQLVSNPPQWPLLTVGLRMCGWGDQDIKYYLLGTPLIWWGGAAALVGFVVMTIVYLGLWQRKSAVWTPAETRSYFFTGLQVCFLGWFLHYFPFFIMGRVTYLHHYFPALYFAILMQCFVLDHITSRYLPEWAGMAVFLLVGAAVTANFWYFKDFALGFDVPAKEYAGRKWLSGWNIYD